MADTAGGLQGLQQATLPRREFGQGPRQIRGGHRAAVTVDEDPRDVGDPGEQRGHVGGDHYLAGRRRGRRRGRGRGRCRGRHGGRRRTGERELRTEHQPPPGQRVDGGVDCRSVRTVGGRRAGEVEQFVEFADQILAGHWVDGGAGDDQCLQDGQVQCGESSQGGDVGDCAEDGGRGTPGAADRQSAGMECAETPEQVDQVSVIVAGEPLGVGREGVGRGRGAGCRFGRHNRLGFYPHMGQ